MQWLMFFYGDKFTELRFSELFSTLSYKCLKLSINKINLELHARENTINKSIICYRGDKLTVI